MHQGHWTCSGCGGAITELPFEPKSDRGLLCRECHRNKNGGGAPKASGDGDKPRFSGNWTCSGCGTAITSLPFEPRDTSNVKCVDCFKKSRG